MALLKAGRPMVSAHANLRASPTLSTISQKPLISLSPTLVHWAQSELVSVCLLGAYTRWSKDTTWTITTNGASLSGSTLSVANKTTAAWAFILGPGTGAITLSDGSGGSATFNVLKPPK